MPLFEQVRENLEDFEKFSRIAALTVFAIHKPRIFEKGRAGDGSMIGEYVDGPYKKKRAKKGRETSFVNLSFTEAMKKDYQPTQSGVVGFGFSNEVEAGKADFNEERYKKLIFELTQEERDLYMATLDQLIFGK